MSTQPPHTLEGKVAIVTGASRGIGETLAYDLASRGANVAITFTSDRSKSSVEALESKIRGETKAKTVAIQADLAEPASATKIVDETVKAFGHIDIVVNNAGVALVKELGKIEVADFEHVYAVNVRAPLLVVQAALPHLRRPGRIINISSVGARTAFQGTGVYASSKAALEGLTRSMALELGMDGTTVNAVNPGPVQSDMLDQISREIVDPQLAATPLQKRAGTTQEIAGIVAFLAEERSSWVTGQCISASGGYHMY